MNFDQAQEGVEALAILIASYYSGLVRNSVPDELARELTLKFQDEQLRSHRAKQGEQMLRSLFSKKTPDVP